MLDRGKLLIPFLFKRNQVTVGYGAGVTFDPAGMSISAM
jgi:hypothetical protein